MIEKIRLISKFITSRPAKQTITIHILTNISRREGNQTIKYGQIIEYNKRKYAENAEAEARRVVIF